MREIFQMEEPQDVQISIKSRISAFEALSKSPQNLLDTPNSPTSSSLSPIIPSTKPLTPVRPISRSPSPSLPSLGSRNSLIDLKEWVVEDLVPPPIPRRKNTVHGNGRPHNPSSPDPLIRPSTPQSTPLIHLEESPPKPTAKAPPLPPRKASYSSLSSVSLSTNSSSSSLPARSPSAPSVPLPPPQTRKKSDSLTVDHTYPPFSKLGISIPPQRNGHDGSGHVHASSISSFHSVSLSSDGGTDPTTPGSLSNHVATFPIDHEDSDHKDSDQNRFSRDREPDTTSLDESYENVSASSAISPSISTLSQDWDQIMNRRTDPPPRLPQRPKPSPILTTPLSPPSGNSPHVSPKLQPKRSPPPPPPPRPARGPPPPSNRSSLASTIASNSDRSSILSNATSRTSLSSVHKPPLISSSSSSTATTSSLQQYPPPPQTYQPPSQNSALGLGFAFHVQQQMLKKKQPPRPTPIPPAARKRYEAVFNGNILASRKIREKENGQTNGYANGFLGPSRLDAKSPPPGSRRRQAAGWRGLSVDLITNPEVVQEAVNGPSWEKKEGSEVGEKEKGGEVGLEERLHGRVVAKIWRASKLDNARLKELWVECDPNGTGSIDRDTFVKAMWKIDEELRRAQLHRNSPLPLTAPQRRRTKTRMVRR